MTPQFFIIAGPNGAGKSIYGRMHIPDGVPIFNGDDILLDFQRRFPHIELERLAGGVAVALENARDKAINDNADFAFESNFSNDMAIDITRRFKEAGYQTTLIYYGLNSLDESVKRVIVRTQLDGHNVKTEDIRFNFYEGIKRVNEHFADFDHIRFVDTSMPFAAPVIAFFNKIEKTFRILNEGIKWFNSHFKDTLEKHVQSVLNEPDIKRSRGRGR